MIVLKLLIDELGYSLIYTRYLSVDRISESFYETFIAFTRRLSEPPQPIYNVW